MTKGQKGKQRRPAKKASTPKRVQAKPAAEEKAKSADEKKSKPVRNIQKHVDKAVREAFSEICSGLIEKAKAGAMGQTKLLMKISGLDESPQAGRKRRGKTLSSMLLAELEKAKKEKLEQEQQASELAG